MKSSLLVVGCSVLLPLASHAGEFDQYLAPDTENAEYVCEVPNFLGSAYYLDTDSSEENAGEITQKLVIMSTRNADSFNYVPLKTRFIGTEKTSVGDRVQEKIFFQPPFDNVTYGVAVLERDDNTMSASLSVTISVATRELPDGISIVYPKVKCVSNKVY